MKSKCNPLLYITSVTFICICLSCGNNPVNERVSEKKETKKESVETDISQNAPAYVLKPNGDTSLNIYLTFDDGPFKTTSDLSKLLTEKNIKTSFFIIGSQVDRSSYYDSVFHSVAENPLFKIFNHSYTHAITGGKYTKYYQNPESVWNDIQKNKTHLPPNSYITRLPGTSTWRIKDFKVGSDKVSKKMMRYLDSVQSNEHLIGWNYSWKPWHSKDSMTVKEMITEVMNKRNSRYAPFKNNTVILLHDYLFPNKTSLDNLSLFIDELQLKYGCTFRWISEYPGVLN
ncbi:MAG: hypothetical protein FGM46_01955 [Ferruginibacter sp.]|nr:hypothetical protein [Ferruginibacter sp.]